MRASTPQGGRAMQKLDWVAVALSLTFIGAGAAVAQSYPSHAVTVVVPFAAGGPVDTIARIVTESMRSSLGQPVVVENLTGAAGTTGTGRVARAPADGYTVVAGYLGTHVLNGALYTLQYDVVKDFEPISLVASNPSLIVAKNTMPGGNLSELIAWLKANPGKASQGTAGVGSPAHVSGAFFQSLTGTRFEFVPYARGAAPAMQDLIGGHVDLMFDQSSNSLPHVRSGRIKAYAVASKTRLASAPGIPTVDEAGLPGFYVSVWTGLWAPKGTPKRVIDRLDDAVVRALSDPRVRQRFGELGLEIPSGALQTPEGFGAFHKAEVDKWWPIIKAAHIKAE